MNAADIRLLSVCVGQPRPVTIGAGPEPTAFVKQATEQPVMAGEEGLAGDALATGRKLGVHNHAVYAIPADTFDYWKERISRPDLPFGGLGENVVIDGPNEQAAAIGDRFEIGRAELTVIQPRIPCYKLAHFLGLVQGFPYEFLKSGRTGFYCAVTRPGAIQQGDTGRWIAADGPRVSISRFIELSQFSTDSEAIAELLSNPHVIGGWKDVIRRRLEQLQDLRRRPVGDGWSEVRCERIDDEGGGIKSFHLRGASGILNGARGGQFLTLRQTIDAKPVIRNYSVSAATGALVAESGCLRISVKLERSLAGLGGRMSSALHQDMVVGDSLSVRPPAGHFTLPEEPGTGEILLISGGIGITPILGILWQAVADGRQENFRLVHVLRADQAFPFAGELEQLARLLPDLRIEAFNTGASGVSENGLNSRNGRPDWNSVLSSLGSGGLVYVCGPGALIDAVAAAARSRGFDDRAIIRESFGALAAPGNSAGANISFIRSGCSARWTPGDGSLLDVAIGNSIDIGYSCRSGICGSCKAPLLAGTVAYPQEMNTATVPDGHILLCSAMPESDLVIDI